MADRILTTGQVAKVMGTNLRTVTRWIDQGHLKGFVIPGSKHRRVEEKYLRDFMKGLGVSLERLGLI